MPERQCHEALMNDGLLPQGSLKLLPITAVLKTAFSSSETAQAIFAQVDTCKSFSQISITVKKIISAHA